MCIDKYPIQIYITIMLKAVHTTLVKDQWPSNTMEDRKRSPTGKYKIPKGNLDRSSVIRYFSQFGAVNLQTIENHFLIYIEGPFRVPAPSMRFLDDTILCNYRLSELDYWEVLEESDELYHMACHYQEGDIIEMYTIEGKNVWPHDVPELPTKNAHESFVTKVRRSEGTNVSIIIDRKDYCKYISALTHNFLPQDFPLISSTITNSSSTEVTINLQCTSNAHVLNCIVSGFGDIKNIHFVLNK